LIDKAPAIVCACWQGGYNKGAYAGKGIYPVEKYIYPTLLSCT